LLYIEPTIPLQVYAVQIKIPYS